MSARAIAVELFVSGLLSSKRGYSVIDGEAVDANGKPNKPSLLPMLFFELILAGIVFFVLPRFGISVMRQVLKAIAFFYPDAASYFQHQGKLKYRSAYVTFAII